MMVCVWFTTTINSYSIWGYQPLFLMDTGKFKFLAGIKDITSIDGDMVKAKKIGQ
jgi:hypothetical protein